MRRSFLLYVPGFRSGQLWKKLVAIPFYLAVSFAIFLIFISGNPYTELPQDNIVSIVEKILIVLFLLIIPFVLLTNIGNIRNHLPLIRHKKYGVKASGWVIILLVIIVTVSLGHSSIQAYYSAEYVEAVTKKREERSLIAEEKAALAAQKKEDKKRADEAKKMQVAEQKQAEKEAKERQKQELATQKAEEKAKRDAEEQAAKLAEEEIKKQEELLSQQSSQEQEQADFTSDIKNSLNQPIEGFKLIQSNGFSLQLPEAWLPVDCFLTSRDEDENLIESTSVPIRVACHFKRSTDYYSEIIMSKYDGSRDYDEHVAYVGSSVFTEEYIKIDLESADAAFVRKKYEETISGKSSWELIVIKNDVSYKLYSYHDVNNYLSVLPDETHRKNIKEFRAFLDVMYSSFQLINDSITFRDIVQ